MKKLDKKGFTLAELLIVVAIIAVLVAISIPVFSAQLEKSRESTDLANIRAAYAEVIVDAIDDDTATEIVVNLKQKEADWQTPDAATTLTDVFGDTSYVTGSIVSGGKATIAWVQATGSGTSRVDGHCTCTFAAGS